MTIYFQDRADAGRRLATALGKLDPHNTVILALPRGGVRVAAEVAEAVGAPLDLIFVRKIGAPSDPELALGAVVDGAEPATVVNGDVAASYGLSEEQVRALAAPLLPEIERRRMLYLGGRAPLILTDKTVIVVDDGIATGASIRSALTAVRRQNPKEIVLAVPVASARVLARIEPLADRIVCLHTPQDFRAVGSCYAHFDQTSDAEVQSLMARLNPQL